MRDRILQKLTRQLLKSVPDFQYDISKSLMVQIWDQFIGENWMKIITGCLAVFSPIGFRYRESLLQFHELGVFQMFAAVMAMGFGLLALAVFARIVFLSFRRKRSAEEFALVHVSKKGCAFFTVTVVLFLGLMLETPVHPALATAHAQFLLELGKPKSVRIIPSLIQVQELRGAIVLWRSQPSGRAYFLTKDGKYKAVADENWIKDLTQQQLADINSALAPLRCEESKKKNPFGGIAKLMAEDFESLKWAGCAMVNEPQNYGPHRGYLNTAVLQEFERGFLVGPLRVFTNDVEKHSKQELQKVYAVFDNGTWQSKVDRWRGAD